MAKTLFIYKIWLPAGTETPYLVAKLSQRDLDSEAVYQVHLEAHKYKDDDKVFICTCPAYKALCKHIHWVKAYRLRTKDKKDVVCAYFDPSKNEMRLVTREEESEDDVDAV